MYNVGAINFYRLTALFPQENELELSQWITKFTRGGHRDCLINSLNYYFTVILITKTT